MPYFPQTGSFRPPSLHEMDSPLKQDAFLRGMGRQGLTAAGLQLAQGNAMRQAERDRVDSLRNFRPLQLQMTPDQKQQMIEANAAARMYARDRATMTGKPTFAEFGTVGRMEAGGGVTGAPQAGMSAYQTRGPQSMRWTPETYGYMPDGVNGMGARPGDAPFLAMPATTETRGFDRFGNETGGFAAQREAAAARSLAEAGKLAFARNARTERAAGKAAERQARLAARSRGAGGGNPLMAAALQGNPAAVQLLGLMQQGQLAQAQMGMQRELGLGNLALGFGQMNQQGQLGMAGLGIEGRKLAIDAARNLALDKRAEEELGISRTQAEARANESNANADYVRSQIGQSGVGGMLNTPEAVAAGVEAASQMSAAPPEELLPRIGAIASQLEGMSPDEQREYLRRTGITPELLQDAAGYQPKLPYDPERSYFPLPGETDWIPWKLWGESKEDYKSRGRNQNAAKRMLELYKSDSKQPAPSQRQQQKQQATKSQPATSQRQQQNKQSAKAPLQLGYQDEADKLLNGGGVGRAAPAQSPRQMQEEARAMEVVRLRHMGIPEEDALRMVLEMEAQGWEGVNRSLEQTGDSIDRLNKALFDLPEKPVRRIPNPW